MKKSIALIGVTTLSALFLSTNYCLADAGFTDPSNSSSASTQASSANTLDDSMYTSYLVIDEVSNLELAGNVQKPAIHPRGDFVLLPAKDLDLLYYLPITSNNEMIKADFTIPTGKQPNDVIISNNGWRAFVTNEGEETVGIYRMDEEDSELITTVNLDGKPVSMAVSPDDQYLYVLCKNDNEVAVIKLDNENSKIVNTLNVGLDPVSIKLSTDGSRGYVVNKGDNSVTEIDLTYPKGEIFKDAISAGVYPTDIALGPNNDIALVSSGLDDEINLFNPTENPAIIFGSIKNLNKPFAMASDPINKFAIAINYYSGGLDFFNLKHASQKNISYLQHDTVLLDDKPEYISINPKKGYFAITHPKHNTINLVKYNIRKDPIVSQTTAPTVTNLSDIDKVINQGISPPTDNDNSAPIEDANSNNSPNAGSTEDIINDVLSEQGNMLRGRTGTH